MKNIYSVLSLGPDGEREFSPCPSLKFARSMERAMSQCSAPGWSRYVVLEEVVSE